MIKPFQKLLNTLSIRHITVAVGDKQRQGIVERFNRTIALMISRYQESRNTNRYIDVLDDIVCNYNHTYHRAINDKPEIRFLKNLSSGTFPPVYTTKYILKMGDKVRIMNNKTVFRKGTFSNDIFQIYKVKDILLAYEMNSEFQLTDGTKFMSYKRSQYNKQNPVRERHLTQQQRRNTRELEHTVEPRHKKRKTFTGHYYFLGKLHNININSYEEYLEHIRNWDNLIQDDHEQLRKWYSDKQREGEETL